jgi:hypothetical protein
MRQMFSWAKPMKIDAKKNRALKRKFVAAGSPFDSKDISHGVLEALAKIEHNVLDSNSLLKNLRHAARTCVECGLTRLCETRRYRD